MEIRIHNIEIRNHPDIPRINIELKDKLYLSGERDLLLSTISNVFYMLNIMNNANTFKEWCADNLNNNVMTIIISYIQYDINYVYYITVNSNNVVCERLS